jgi:hypothetical protein
MSETKTSKNSVGTTTAQVPADILYHRQPGSRVARAQSKGKTGLPF